MTLREKPTSLAFRLTHPKTTVRWRLMLLYGGLFLASGVALLAITYTLVSHAAITHPGLSRRAFAELPHSHAGRGRKHLGKPVSDAQLRAVALQLRKLFRTPVGQSVLRFVYSSQRISDLHHLVIESGIALAIMTVISALLGWLVAGRVLAPLRTITASTQEISEANLHQRLALPGARDELGRLADTIDGLLDRLELAFDSQRRFVANASHELRTPLAMMRATLDVAIGKPEGVPPQVTRLDADLREDLDRADRLLESFLVLARAQNGAVGDQSSVSLKQIVTVALAARCDDLAGKRIKVRTTLLPVHVAGSETLLARMVENVIENAVRHNQPGGFINVSCTIDREMSSLVVESGGLALDQRDVAELAQPFRRLEEERTHSQNGHGLGLSIVAAIAAAHGGVLDLQARAEGGLRVGITLPSATLIEPAEASR